jgi:hypothetical protein
MLNMNDISTNWNQ